MWCGNNYMNGTFPRYFYFPTFLSVKYNPPPHTPPPPSHPHTPHPHPHTPHPHTPHPKEKYDTSCHVRSITYTYTVPDRFFPYLAQMITSMRGCVARNDLWPWPISSRSFSHSAVTWAISWIIFISGTNITHGRRPFPGQYIKGQCHTGHSNFCGRGEGYPNVRRSRSTISNHDDVIKWKHFPLYWPFVRGIHRSPVNSPHKGQWRGAFVFSLICAWTNGWVNNRGAGGLDAIALIMTSLLLMSIQRHAHRHLL